MSDRLTNMEIQDVLSSIRRLVSEDNRHREERVTRGRGAMASAEDGKLVLTEALRVAEPEPAAPESVEAEIAGIPAPAAGGAPAEDESLRLSVTGEGRFDEGALVPPVTDAPDAALADVPTLEDTIAELEAAVSRRGWDFEPDGSEVRRGALADAALEEAFENGFGVDEAAEDDEAALSQPITAEAIADTQVAAMSEAEGPAPEPELTAAEGEDQVGEVVAAETFDFAPSDDGIPLARIPVEAPFLRTAAAMAAHADSPSWAKRPEPAAEPAPDAPAIEAEADLPEVAEVAEETAEETPKRPSRIRRLTLMPSDRTDVAEDIADEQLADISPAIPGADAGAEEDTDASLFAAGDETVIDMDMLRDLVAEIIRQELQGNLGERITRNVRMLVRREVNRALEGRSFE
ncbi:MAG: hypothetical protein KDE00_14835 [Rhodobacteraceae bacterium]|nr:hypothetical protein [Paracoccaceae bacterium]